MSGALVSIDGPRVPFAHIARRLDERLRGMTFPPQQHGPEYGAQYGQPGYGGYPQSGGYPQQPDPYAQYGQPPQFQPPYGQTPYGQPPQAQPGAYGGPQPPPSGKTGLVAVLSVGGGLVLALTIFLVTGFLAPGFLVDESESDTVASDSGSGSGSTAGSDSGSATTGTTVDKSDSSSVARAFVASLNNGNAAGGRKLMCSDNLDLYRENIKQVAFAGADLRIVESSEYGDFSVYDLDGTIGGEQIDSATLFLHKRGTIFCITTLGGAL